MSFLVHTYTHVHTHTCTCAGNLMPAPHSASYREALAAYKNRRNAAPDASGTPADGAEKAKRKHAKPAAAKKQSKNA